MVFGDMVGVQLREDGNLLDDVLDFILCVFDVNHFNGDGAAVGFVDAAKSLVMSMVERSQ